MYCKKTKDDATKESERRLRSAADKRVRRLGKKRMFLLMLQILVFILGLVVLCCAITKGSWLLVGLSAVIYLIIFTPIVAESVMHEEKQPPRKKYTLTGR